MLYEMTQKERQERSRRLIVEAAMQEFGSLGYDNVSVELVCRKHGISKGMMYHYYNGKDNLFLECVSHTFALLCEFIEGEEPKFDSPDALENIKDFLMAREIFFRDHPHEKTLFECAVFHHPRHLAQAMDEARRGIRKLNMDFIGTQLARMKLRNGLDSSEVGRYLGSIDFLFQDLLTSYTDGKKAENIHDMLTSAGELLSMLLFGVIER